MGRGTPTGRWPIHHPTMLAISWYKLTFDVRVVKDLIITVCVLANVVLNVVGVGVGKQKVYKRNRSVDRIGRLERTLYNAPIISLSQRASGAMIHNDQYHDMNSEVISSCNRSNTRNHFSGVVNQISLTRDL